MRVDENDPVEAIGHVPLEEQRDVADHDPVAALARLLDQPIAQALDLRMDDLVKFFELFVVGEHDATQRGAIEMSVGREHRVAPRATDLVVRGGSGFDGSAREHIGVDDRRAALGQHLRDRRLAAADVARESNEEHDGFLDGHGPASPCGGLVTGSGPTYWSYARRRQHSRPRASSGNIGSSNEMTMTARTTSFATSFAASSSCSAKIRTAKGCCGRRSASRSRSPG